MFWVISVYFNLRNTLPKFGTFLLGQPVYMNIVKEIKQYQEKWLQHAQRMDTNRLPKQALQYKPKGRRNIGQPRKRWRDQLHLEDQGTG